MCRIVYYVNYILPRAAEYLQGLNFRRQDLKAGRRLVNYQRLKIDEDFQDHLFLSTVVD